MKTLFKKMADIGPSRSISLFMSTMMALLLSFTATSQMSMLSFEGAEALGPARFETGVMINPLYVTFSGSNEKLFDRFGAYFRMGVHRNIDLKFSYARMYHEKMDNGMNFVQFGPKISDNSGRISLSVPFGIFFEKNKYSSEYGGDKYNSFYSLSPRLIMTAVQNRVIELNLTPTGEFLFDKGSEGTTLFGLAVGLGFSNNFDKWSVRPECGMRFLVDNIDVFYWSFGISGALRFGSGKN